MVVNDLLMQFQADILNATVVRPEVIETTALGLPMRLDLLPASGPARTSSFKTGPPNKRWRPAMSEVKRTGTPQCGMGEGAGPRGRLGLDCL